MEAFKIIRKSTRICQGFKDERSPIFLLVEENIIKHIIEILNEYPQMIPEENQAREELAVDSRRAINISMKTDQRLHRIVSFVISSIVNRITKKTKKT